MSVAHGLDNTKYFTHNSSVKLTLQISDEMYDELDLLTPEGVRVEKFIEKRLPLLLRINPDRPHMYLNGDDIAALNALFGGHVFTTPADLISYIKRTQSFRIKGQPDVEITLDADLMATLHRQSIGMGIPFDRYLRENVNEALMYIVGIPIHVVTVPGDRN